MINSKKLEVLYLIYGIFVSFYKLILSEYKIRSPYVNNSFDSTLNLPA